MNTPIPGSRYCVHPAFAMEATSIRLIEERTGKTFGDWVQLAATGPAAYTQRAAWLKDAHGLTSNYANWVAERSFGRGGAENYRPDELVEAMFSGKKAALRPLYDRLLDLCLSLAPDITACPCETIVPIYRNHVIAQIKPATNTRIDFGLALKGTPAEGRLIDTGGWAKKDRITHRIPVSSLEDIDDELKQRFQCAYDLDAK